MSQHAQAEVLGDVVNQFESGVCDCCAAGGGCCLASFCLPCGARCVAATAMARMEDDKCGSKLCCWYWCCASQVMMRGLARTVYGIYGSPGNDLCIGCCCSPCSAIQLLHHSNKHKSPQQPPENPAFDYVHEKGCFASGSGGEGAVCSDPLNCIFLCALCSEESASHASQTTGLPFWFHFCCSNYCVNHHIIRIQNGVPGSTCWHDCFEPFYCGLLSYTIFCPCTSYYFAQQILNEHNVIKQAAKYDQPRLFDPLAANAIPIHHVPLPGQSQQQGSVLYQQHSLPTSGSSSRQVAQTEYVVSQQPAAEEKDGGVPMVVLDATAAADELSKQGGGGESHYYRDL